MIDFMKISTRQVKKGVTEIFPKFVLKKSSDLMIRGGDFYAVWNEDTGLWSTDEEDVINMVDAALYEYTKKQEEHAIDELNTKYMWDSNSGSIDAWHKYCQKQMRDNYHPLDEKIIFGDAKTTKKDYASRTLSYPLKECDISGYEKLMSTLYSPEERQKIEWAIGAVIEGDSKNIQKFMVLYGSAGTGKSTVLNIIQQLFEGYYSVFDAKALGSANNSFALEAFKTNPLIAIQHDGDLSKIEDNTRLNSLVSHELMTVNESYKSLSTTAYVEGTTILWRVRTAGVTGKYGAWSVQRTINVYAVPTVQLNVTDSTGSEVTTLESFPFYIKAETAPNTQSVLSYHVSITSTQAYSTSDRTGTETVISRGQEVYSLFTDGPQNLLVELNAGNIDLENNITYKVTCTASFDSGLTASAESEFNVGWTEQTYGINAEIGYDSDTYSCSIRAYCADEENKLIPGVTLAIYRRDYTGELIEIASELDNSSYTYVTDPHPALDYGRYRIVATEVSTGAISYYDVPPYPIKETSIIIQWEETWDNLVTEGLNERDIVMEPLWSGSLVKLPYNIDVSDKNGVDVSLVEYIGRKRPVSYYGTQLGETSSWKTEIPRGDIDTLYALRRLAVYTGDVYIREPSGTGYWANVAVSISQTHCEVKIPVSFDITRVEGGI